MALAERLRDARNRAGLTGSQIRELTDIGESSLSDFENAKREPSLSQLQALAKVYHRSLSFFFSEEPIPHEIVLWRERPKEASHEIEAKFLRLCEQYHNLEIWCGEKVTSSLPKVSLGGGPFGYPQTEELARRVRRQLQFGDRPAQGLLNVLEEICGVKIFHLDFEPTGTAASTWSETFGTAVLLNSKNVRWRRNHDLAHELFHLLTWEIFRSPSDSSSCTPSDKEESLATCFAVNLLMPEEVTRTAVDSRLKDGKLPFGALFDIARQFDVSVESLLWRIQSLYRRPADKSRTESDIQRAKALASVFEEREEASPPTPPARYHALAVKALSRGEISIGRFAEYLDIRREEAMRIYVEQGATCDEEVQVTSA